MPSYQSKTFVNAEDEAEIRDALLTMQQDSTMNTTSSYSANATLHPDHVLTFMDKHMAFMKSHPQIDPQQYLANLRLMIRHRK